MEHHAAGDAHWAGRLNMRICFFGDSFVNGFGDPHCQGWVGRICAKAWSRGDHVTADNCGVRRATSEDVRTNWLAEAAARLPIEHRAAVIFSFGANDRSIEASGPRVSHERQIENVRAILTSAVSRWPTLFVSAPPAIHESARADATRQVATFAGICRDLQVHFLDVGAASSGFKRWRAEALAGDGAHPGAGGYEEFADVVEAWPPWHALIDQLRN